LGEVFEGLMFVTTLIPRYRNFSMISFPAGRPPGAIAEDGSWRFRQRQGRGTKGHHEKSSINREKPCVAQTCLRNTKGTVLL